MKILMDDMVIFVPAWYAYVTLFQVFGFEIYAIFL